MAKFNILSKDGSSIRHTGEPQYSGTYLGVDFIEFRTISSPAIIDWEVGDYVDYFRTGQRYKLYTLPMPQKVARAGSYGGAIEYSNVQFFAASKDLEIAPFVDLVPNDNGIHFSTRSDVSTFEDVYGIARRIEACMNNIFPNRWKVNVYESDDDNLNALLSEAKDFSVSQGSCMDALSQIYDTWKGVGWIHTTENGQEVVTIGRANVRDAGNTTDEFTYGVGNGLTSIKKAAANDEFATRLYVYGSNRNLPHRYYNQFNIVEKESADIQNLMIPLEEWGLTNGIPDPSKAYLQADDALIAKYGLIPRTVYFDGSQHEEIYPSIVGITEGKVREYMIKAGQGDSPLLPPDTNDRIDKVLSVEFADDKGSIDDVTANRTFTLWVRGVGFDIAEQGKKTEEGHATISMKGGACIGREFVVKKSRIVGYAQELTLERNWDESINMGFPNRQYPIKQNDQFVLLDIPMPDFYVSINSGKLLEKGRQLLADYTRVSAFYEPGINAIRMKHSGGVITPGMFMKLNDADIIDTEDHKDYVLIDSVTIDENSEIPSYRITLREQKRSARTFSALEEMIEDAREDASQAIKRERQYTERRFRSAQETLKMLESAFGNFSKGITPITVQTMSMLVGDESLQYKFTKSRESLVDVPCPLSWSAETKQMIGVPASLLHMTLDITGVVPTGTRGASDYKSWNIVSWWDKGTFESPFLEDGEKSYYVYVKASKDSADAWFYMDENPHSMIEDDAYYFMVGILNAEYDGNRDFVTLYGFTEVLPGQITTDVIRSADGRTYFDLMRGEIGGTIRFVSSNGEDKSMSEFADEQKAEFSKVDKNVQNLQDQIDGVVENHFYEGTPTTSNEPASLWTTDEQKINHIGDTYTDISEIEEDPNAGKSWRWCRCDTVAPSVQLSGRSFPTDWYKLGTIDATKTYFGLEYYHNGTYQNTFEIEFDKDIQIVSGPPIYVKIESATGDVYVKDAYGYFSSNVLSLVFKGTDYVEVTDKDGMTYKLHWHPIADTDAVKALLKTYELEKRVSDAEYLKDTFKKGSTEVKGGVVMSQMVAVRDDEDSPIEAFLNGSDFAESEDSGKLILAGGIPTQTKAGSSDLEERAKEAKIRMYEDGDFIMKGGGISVARGNIGPFYLSEFNMAGEEKLGEEHSQVVLSRDDFSLTSKEGSEKYIQVSIGGDNYSSSGNMMDADYNVIFKLLNRSIRRGISINTEDSGDDSRGVLYINRKGEGNKCSIQVDTGYFAGLRPMTRVIKTTGTSTDPHQLSDFDHTIIITEWSNGRVYLKLPGYPQIGQVYEIYSSNAKTPISIDLAGNQLFDMVEGSQKTSESFDSQQRRYIKLVYVGTEWWETYNQWS